MLETMEQDNLTVRILQEIRDEVRRASDKSEQSFARMDERFAKMDERFAKADERFEVIETTLKDLAEQMLFLARGIENCP